MPTVLIVDDDNFIRAALENIITQDPVLRGLDIEVITASNGKSAVELFIERRPDVLVTDLLMPRMDGFAVCEAIRSKPGGEDVAIAVISGVYRDNAIVKKVEEEYGAKFYTKPYQLKDLTSFIAKVLETKRGGRPRANTPPPIPIVRFDSSGNLTDRSLAAVLLDLSDRKATGTLALKRGKISKLAHLYVGHPLAVESNARSETLGAYLISRGVISDDQHKAAITRATEHKKKLGLALIEIGAITPEQLIERLTEQTKFKLVQSLRWPDGTWSFQPNEVPTTRVRTDAIDVTELVVDGLAKSAVIEPLPSRIMSLVGRPLELTDRGRRLMPMIGRVINDKLGMGWAPGATMQALFEEGIDRMSVYTALDVLLLCDALIAQGEMIASPKVLLDSADSFTVSDLSDRAESMQSARGARKPELYNVLFGDSSSPGVQVSGAIPLDVELEDAAPIETMEADSGVLDISGIEPIGGREGEEQRRIERRKLLAEYLRVQGLSHYDVLRVPSGADPATIAAALAQLQSEFSHEWYARFDLGRDYSRLEDIHAAYRAARDVLLDDPRRRAYDRELSGDTLPAGTPSLEAEIAFRAADELLIAKRPAEAIARLNAAVKLSPNEASYHALLGWAHYLRSDRTPMAADAARAHLNQALAIDPDHSQAHEYKGIIGADLGNDDAEAAFHLGKALEADPGASEALAKLEQVRQRQGELRPLERDYRKLAHRVAGRDPRLELILWLKLARLYRDELSDPESARVAYGAAARLAPDDTAIQAALADIDAGTVDRFHERSADLVQKWRDSPGDPASGIALMAEAIKAERHDAAFITASLLVALGSHHADADQLYQRHRPRFVLRAQRGFDDEVWTEVRHTEDEAALEALFARLGAIADATLAMQLSDLEVDEAAELTESQLPPAFSKVRAYIAHVLDVGQPRVYLRSDFGHQIHVGATSPPVLLAGEELLSSPERSELAFRLGRAMTYLRPGRALAGSHPARLLKQLVLAAYASANPAAAVELGDGFAGVRDRIDQLPDGERDAIWGLVSFITASNDRLNLSRWVRAMSRTADRVGLVLCGDVPAAVRFARDGGSREHVDELCDFAMSPAFAKLRATMGLSIDV